MAPLRGGPLRCPQTPPPHGTLLALRLRQPAIGRSPAGVARQPTTPGTRRSAPGRLHCPARGDVVPRFGATIRPSWALRPERWSRTWHSRTQLLAVVARALEFGARGNDYVQHFGPVRGVRFLAAARPGNSSTADVRVDGYPDAFRLRLNGGSDLATLTEVLLDESYRLPFDLQPTTIVDAGANIGLASAYFARRFPEARIVALEPDRTNYDLMCHNVRAFPNVEPVWAALWATTGTVQLADPRRGPRGYMVLRCPRR